MLKVFFPGGDSLVAPNVLNEMEQTFVVGNPANTPVKFLSRIFSMLSLEQIGIDLNKKKLETVQNLTKIDFDIAQFCSLLERYKFTYRTAFQVILFRAFITGRASITNCAELVNKLSFNRQESGGIIGLLMKSIMSRTSLRQDTQNESLYDEFKFFNQSEIVKIVEHGAELWMILKKIHLTGCNRSSSQKDTEKLDHISYLKSQFDEAHEVFVAKMIEHNANP